MTGGGDGSAIHAEELVTDHRHAPGLTPGAQILHMPGAEAAESEIGTNMDECRSTFAENRLEERLGGLGGEFTGEGQHRHGIDAGSGQGRQALLVAEELLQPGGSENLVGVDVEGDRNGATPFGFGGQSLGDHEPMAHMEAVEDAEDAGRSGEEVAHPCGIKGHDLSHSQPQSRRDSRI